MNLRRELLEKRNRTDDSAMFKNFWDFQSNNRNEPSSDGSEVLSEISEDDLDKDKVRTMLDEEYQNISSDSTLKKLYGIKRLNYCEIGGNIADNIADTSDPSDPSDPSDSQPLDDQLIDNQLLDNELLDNQLVDNQ